MSPLCAGGGPPAVAVLRRSNSTRAEAAGVCQLPLWAEGRRPRRLSAPSQLPRQTPASRQQERGTAMARMYKVISADGHVEAAPTEWEKYIPSQYRERAPRRIQ